MRINVYNFFSDENISCCSLCTKDMSLNPLVIDDLVNFMLKFNVSLKKYFCANK